MSAQDRLCNLFGAERYLTETEYAVVVDFGTSTNFDVIGRGRRFIGGVLATGAQVSADALFARAAALPRINLEAPISAIGKNTVHALQSGLVFGYAEMVDGLLRRIRAELPGPAIAIATGGFARTVEGSCTEIDVYDDTLTLRGLVELWASRQETLKAGRFTFWGVAPLTRSTFLECCDVKIIGNAGTPQGFSSPHEVL